jgi:outer membrane receptor protein involved in Fe transport
MARGWPRVFLGVGILKTQLFATVASLAIASPAFAGITAVETADAAATADGTAQDDAAAPAKAAAAEVFSTGVAKGRDRLDSAISTSSLKESEILKFAPASIGDLLRDIPGIRSEAYAGEGNANITIRGLPMSSTGAKFVQLQEDGLPILEFGDIAFSLADSFLRADINLSQLEVIRGGSASTFASNSPGGIINFQSKTGDVEGGAIQLSSGLGYDEKRIDMDYGAKLGDGWRFHTGGFYRQGEGPRRAGFDAKKGGQFKFNVTKEFSGGHIRFYGKYLDDRTPIYDVLPLGVTGSNADPEFKNIPGIDVRRDTLLSRYFPNTVTLDQNNAVQSRSTRDGQHVQYKSLGFEAQFDVGAGWTVTDRFRYADIKSSFFNMLSTSYFTPQALSAAFAGGPGATFSYATGPRAGTAITNPNQLNGNGLIGLSSPMDSDRSLDNVTNDLRVSRVWAIGNDELTTTAGVYSSSQQIAYTWVPITVLNEVRGDGTYALLNMRDAAGRALTQDGIFSFAALGGPAIRRNLDMTYKINAPFASANYRFGRIAIGGSVRYDVGQVSGTRNWALLGPALVSRDMNGDGTISIPETKVASLPLSRAQAIDFDYGYLSYSTGINVRLAEPLAVFARYSRGGRASERLLFTPFFNPATGSLANKNIKVDFVNQAEAGVKYRRNGLTLNVTGFWAKAEDTSVDAVTRIPFQREYKAAGVEFEGGYRLGNFSIAGGATYTDAEISKDATNAAIAGNTPRHQAKFIFQATPQFTTDRFSIGAVFIGTTDSFAQDQNVLKVPGYMTTNAFVQVRPTERLLLSLNAANLFNVLAINAISDPAIPASGIVSAQVLTGRTVSAAARFAF